jgi:hypothetical protein
MLLTPFLCLLSNGFLTEIGKILYQIEGFFGSDGKCHRIRLTIVIIVLTK